MLLVTNLNGVFDDSAAADLSLLNSSAMPSDEGPLPAEYLFAAKSEESGHIHAHGIKMNMENISQDSEGKHNGSGDEKKSLIARLIKRAGELFFPTLHKRNANYFNAGFMVLKPSMEQYNYYIRLTGELNDGRWDNSLNEQNLWNYAHRANGPQPFTRLKWDWNVHGSVDKDFAYGVKS